MRGILAGLVAALLGAAAPPSYKGVLTIPVDLYSADGTQIPKGRYDVEIRSENAAYTLSFVQEGKRIALVKQRAAGSTSSASIPLIGTQFLRSSADPVQTAQERQFSKTGLPQYAEQTRDWKATLRSYRTADHSEAVFVLQERKSGGAWGRVEFPLSLKPPIQK
jgi:hypothetical protein